MPHVIIKLQSGRSEQQKRKIAEEVTKAIMTWSELRGAIRVGQYRGHRAERLGREGL